MATEVVLACPRCMGVPAEGTRCLECEVELIEVEVPTESRADFPEEAQRLRTWRGEQARIQRLERYRVLPNRTLLELAAQRPTTAEGLASIGGIGPAKQQAYGYVLLRYFRERASGGRPDGPLLVSAPIPDGLSEDQLELLFDVRRLRGLPSELAAERKVGTAALEAQLVALVAAGCPDVVHLLCSPAEIHRIAEGLRAEPTITDEALAEALPETSSLSRRLVRAALEHEADPEPSTEP